MVGITRVPSRSGRFHSAAVLFLGLCTFIACKTDRTPELLGAWQATMLIEEGDTIDVILDDVGLYFDKDGTYIYTSTLDYEESGTFRTSGEMIFTTPVKQDTLVERPVAIALLSKNTLHLNMKEGDKNRILEFERIVIADPVDEVDANHEGHDHSHEDHQHDLEMDESDIGGVIDTTGLSEIND